MAKIIIENHQARLLGVIDKHVVRKLSRELSYQVQGHQFMNVPGWDGRYRLLKKTGYFPIGLLSRVKKVLKESDINYEEIDKRAPIKYGLSLKLNKDSHFEARTYQAEAIDTCLKKESGIIRIATGGGKTLIIGRIAGEMNIKTVIYVIGIELLYQMKDTMEALFPNTKIGIVGDGQCDIQDITIATVWSAAAAFNKKITMIDSDLTSESPKKTKLINKQSVRNMVNESELIIIDECQYAAAETIQFLHRESYNARHRFLFSGTPWRETGDDLLIEAVGGQRIVDIDASFLIERGFLVPPEIHFINVPTMKKPGGTYSEVYKNYIEKNSTRNMLIIEATKQLVDMGRKVLILVTKVDHGKTLLQDLSSDLRVASLDGRNSTVDRLENIGKMKNGELDVLIASKIFDQGVDIPNLDALVLAGSGKSGARALQRIGRVIRKNDGKDRAIVVDFKDNCKYLRNHSKARYKIYKTERLFEIKVQSE